jgi:hypothetical protein
LAFSGGAVSGQPEQTPLNLHITPGKVRFGHAVTVIGTVPSADAGHQVALLTAASDQSTWRRIATTTAARNGHFAFRIVPRRSGLLRAVVPTVNTAVPTTGAEMTLGMAGTQAGPARPVTVGARFAVPTQQRAVLGGGPVHVGGKLVPAIGRRVVKLQAHSPRGWHTVASGHTGAGGGFRLSFAPAAGSGQRLRMLFGGDGGNARSTQPAGTVTVLHPVLASWYNDAGTTGCGFHAGLGVANKSLPCGTHVALHYGGRTVNAVVDDRGPYVGGRTYDLNQNTAAALGFAGVGTVWASIG